MCRYKKLRSRKDELKHVFSKYYTEYQAIGLLGIMKEEIIPKGTVIKERDKSFDGVFVIFSGDMGLYVYPYG